MASITYKKDIVPIALPIFLGMLVFQIQTLVNRAFLGHLDAANLSVVSNVIFPMWTTMAMLNSLTTGATILMSQYLGAGNTKKAKEISASAMKWSGAFSMVLFLFWFFFCASVFKLMGVSGQILESCVAYTRVSAFSFLFGGLSSALTATFQASGRTKPLMYSGALRSGLNVLLDWLLIFGSLGFPRLGLEGAALASVLSDFAGLVLLVALFVGDRSVAIRPKLREILASRLSSYRAIVRMGVPTSLEDLLWNLGNLFLIRFLNALDPLATAVYSLVFTIEILPIAVFMSLGQTTTVLTGRAKGGGEYAQARQATLKAQLAAWAASVAVAFLFLVAPRGIVEIFTADEALASRVVPILLVSCFTFIPRSVNFMAGSGIRGLGDTRWMLLTQIFGTVFIVCLGRVLIFSPGLGVIGLFIAMLADEGVRSIANFLRLRSSLRSNEARARAAGAADIASTAGTACIDGAAQLPCLAPN